MGGRVSPLRGDRSGLGRFDAERGLHQGAPLFVKLPVLAAKSHLIMCISEHSHYPLLGRSPPSPSSTSSSSSSSSSPPSASRRARSPDAPPPPTRLENLASSKRAPM